MPLALVIDDEDDTREQVAQLLRQADCEVIQAGDGRDGIARLEESSPDFVVLDVQMPQPDGWETLKGIRARSDVPVLMLTSEKTEQEKVRGLVAGADDYIAKPVSSDEFVSRVKAILRRSGEQDGRPERIVDDPGFEPGDEVGSYRVDSLIARGGMSAVYRATHSALDRTVALKIVSGDLSRDKVSRERFTMEWLIAAGLKHPNILPVYDAGELDDLLFLAMEFVEGGDLGHKIDVEGALAPEVALPILEQMASALDAAHAAGLVHRDFKPGNVLLDGDRALLTDFGLSKVLGARRITAPGRMVGTAQYLSPEQIRGEAVTPQTDVYALGCVIYEALTASAPFEAESDFVMMYAHLERAAPRISERRPESPEAADDVVQQAMEKLPEDRFASAGATIRALKAAFGYE